jgi:hypothetical protein
VAQLITQDLAPVTANSALPSVAAVGKPPTPPGW